MAQTRLCEVDGCGKKHDAKGFCKNHLYKFDRYGDPLAGRSLTPRGEALAFLFSLLEEEKAECVYWPYYKFSGRGYAGVYYKGKVRPAHRVVCEILNGPPPSEIHEAAHNCGQGIQGCVNPYHTRWDTPKGNVADQVRHGTRRRGIKMHTAKLTPNEVRSLRDDISRGCTQVATAEKYGISRRQVRDIISGGSWSWLDA